MVMLIVPATAVVCQNPDEANLQVGLIVNSGKAVISPQGSSQDIIVTGTFALYKGDKPFR